MTIKCPHCGYSGEVNNFSKIKSWRFRIYDVVMLKCPQCGGVFNYYKGISPRKGTLSEFYVKIKPRRVGSKRKVFRRGR